MAGTELLRKRVVTKARELTRSLGTMGPWNGGMWNTIPGPYTSVFIGDNGVAPMLWPVPESVALSIAAFYRGVAIYADTLSTLPITTLRGSERIDDPSWLVHPAGSEVGWTDECAQVVWSLIMRGNAYAVPTSYGYDGYPTSFVVLNPDYVSLTLVAEGVLYSWTNIDGSTSSMLNPSGLDLLHIRLHRTPGNYLGLGVLDVAGGPFGTLSGVAATQRYATDVMANPSPPAVLNSALRLNKAQAEALQEQWADSVARARAIPAVLSGGITYQALNVTPRDVELIATRRWNATEIAVLLGLPPYLLGGDTGTSLTYSTTEAELSRLWILGLMPVAVAVERGFGAWVPRGQRIRFVPDAVLRAQTKDRYDAYKVGLDAGFLTIAEVRETEHLGELPEELMPSQDNPPPVSGLGEPVPAQSRPLPPAGPDQPSPNPPLPLAAVPGGN